MTNMQQALIIPDAPRPEAPPAPSPKTSWAPLLWRIALWVLIIDVAIVSVLAGLRLRRWAWEQTTPIRYVWDITNGYERGHQAADVGLVKVYDDIAQSHVGETDPQYGLDYSPLRLTVMMQWYKWTRQQPEFAAAPSWQPSYAFNRPVLGLNTVCELASAIAMFLIVRLWVLRAGMQPGVTLPPAERSRRAGWAPVLGLLAGLLVWFNPAVIWEAHCWPQWDVWLLPFFLFAVFLASTEWWMGAGALLAIGALFKGQIAMIAPVFVLWPLLSWRLGAALRLVIGAVLTGSVLLSPWILRTPEARLWIGMVMLAAALLSPWPFIQPKGRRWWIAAAVASVIAAALLVYPWKSIGWFRVTGLCLVLASILALILRFILARRVPYAIAAMLAAAMVLCVPLFDGSMSWYRIGFEYGTRHFPDLVRPDSSNLAAILANQWHWKRDDVVVTIPAPQPGQPHAWWQPAQDVTFTVRDVLVSAFALSLLLCGIGAARHARRNDPRLLFALAAPWVLLFALLPQIHQRYLLWGAVVTAMGLAADVGAGLLLHLLVTALAWAFMAHTMLRIDPRFSPWFWRLLEGSHPGIGWATLLCAFIYLYLALSSDTKRS